MRVRVRVHPGARRERMEEIKPGVFEVAVREEAERNEANERVRTLLARHFHVTLRAVRLVSGRRSSSKSFEISK